MSGQHGPFECAAPATVYSGSLKHAVDQRLTADMADFVIFSPFSFLSHTTRDQHSLWILFLFSNPEMTTRAGGEFVTLQCAD